VGPKSFANKSAVRIDNHGLFIDMFSFERLAKNSANDISMKLCFLMCNMPQVANIHSIPVMGDEPAGRARYILFGHGNSNQSLLDVTLKYWIELHLSLDCYVA
jgi:hypothetical protein